MMELIKKVKKSIESMWNHRISCKGKWKNVIDEVNVGDKITVIHHGEKTTTNGKLTQKNKDYIVVQASWKEEQWTSFIPNHYITFLRIEK